MKYDDASWHYDGDFPTDLPPEAGGTHIGMFLAWCLLNGMTGELHHQKSVEGLQNLRDRTVPPSTFLFEYCDEKFIGEDLNDEGNRFAVHYYDLEKGNYLHDYERCFSRYPNLYYVPDTWESYDKLAPKITKRFQTWKKKVDR